MCIRDRCYTAQGKPETSPNCLNDQGIVQFFENAEFRKAFKGKDGVSWRTCDLEVAGKLSEKEGALDLVATMLKARVRVLVMSGDGDSRAPTIGTQRWLKGMQDDGSLILREPTTQWEINGQVGGWITRYGVSRGPDLWFVIVRGAGQKIASDRPKSASKLIEEFTSNGGLFQWSLRMLVGRRLLERSTRFYMS
eukprot:TRINITY_DN6207_c0_g1_i16.p2 TRINITY_DN6207_c0_g1~~TRINITY_DN6207_c0_g1_i16.p2  ORF type:complete len:194 (-),score=32.72 TRINITY_DN6207_c0_g1_i16:156-737(-)